MAGEMERPMPLARYFYYVGGVLLALLFISDAYFPKLPVEHSASTASYVIRIHSDRKWPERIVYDTSLPTIIPAQVANMEESAAAPATIAPAKAGEWEAYAQLPFLKVRASGSGLSGRGVCFAHSLKGILSPRLRTLSLERERLTKNGISRSDGEHEDHRRRS